MNTNISKIACLMLLLCFGAMVFAQTHEDDNPPPQCSRLDKTKPPLFISFEQVESRKVFLRLNNNSRCALLIPTNQIDSSIRVVKQASGRLRVEPIEELKDGSQVPVVYNLFNSRSSKDAVIVSDGDVVITRKLLPQQSIVFAVPLENFRKNVDVGVEISYLWEESGWSTVGGGFGHYVFFRSKSLPRNTIR